MPTRIKVTTLNANSMDIINTIRANASYSYQQNVPAVTQLSEIPKVGDVIYGYPAFANEFINALINRIAIVKVKSATFNNKFGVLKKGYLGFGETVEEVFVEITKAQEFNVEKAPTREFKRTIPDVRSAFHALNWKVMYPVTVQQEDLRQAFTSQDGVTNLIGKIINQVYTAAEYDEYLLFKYLIIKAVTGSKMHPVTVSATDNKDAAVEFRAVSGDLTFMSNTFNNAGVHTATDVNDQYIFMDNHYAARYDVEVLADAFNMDKVSIKGHLIKVDSFATFDNERFSEIRAGSDGIEEVTADELALMAKVKAILVDKEWFQVYDNLIQMKETQVGSGLYWNYWLHIWKTVSTSPFSNAVVFVDSTVSTDLPNSLTVEITGKDISEEVTVFTLGVGEDTVSAVPTNVEFVQTSALTTAGIAVHKYGAVMIPASKSATNIALVAKIGEVTYTATTNITSASDVGDTVTLEQD